MMKLKNENISDINELKNIYTKERKFIKRPTFMAWGDASLSVKNKEIYFAKDLQVGLFEKLVWDTGMDPSLDPF